MEFFKRFPVAYGFHGGSSIGSCTNAPPLCSRQRKICRAEVCLLSYFQEIENAFQLACITLDTCTKSPITTLSSLLQRIFDGRHRECGKASSPLSHNEKKPSKESHKRTQVKQTKTSLVFTQTRNYEIRTPSQWKRCSRFAPLWNGRSRQCCLMFLARFRASSSTAVGLCHLRLSFSTCLGISQRPQRLCLLVAARRLEVDRFVHLTQLVVHNHPFWPLHAFADGLTNCMPVLIHKRWHHLLSPTFVYRRRCKACLLLHSAASAHLLLSVPPL